MLDGEWKNIKKIHENIKVNGEDLLEFEIGYTHRGPLIDINDLLDKAAMTPKIERDVKYSFGWANQLPVKDQSLKLLMEINKSETVKQVM